MSAQTVPDHEQQLRAIADRLTDIAGQVAAEAEAATATVRDLVQQADRVAMLAKALETAATTTEAGVLQQAGTLATARIRFDRNASVVEGLAQSIDSVATISATIGGIAQESRILSLNARIEAARTEGQSGAFAAVAAEMSVLAARVLSANEQIGDRTGKIAYDVGVASDVVVSHAALLHEQDDLIVASLSVAGQQREAAIALSEITGEIATALDAAAHAIGRVGAGAVTAKVLARQLGRMTGPPQ